MALEKIGYDDTTAGETFELYGPTNYSMAEIAGLVDKEIIKHRRHVNREVIHQPIAPNAKTFKNLGIEPAELADLTFHYLVRCFLPIFSPFTLLPPSNLVPFCLHSLHHILIPPIHHTARLPQLLILRPPTRDGTREERGEEIHARYRRPVESFQSGEFSCVQTAVVRKVAGPIPPEIVEQNKPKAVGNEEKLFMRPCILSCRLCYEVYGHATHKHV